MREEEFLIQLWLKVNPVNEENVDSHIVLEFMKLIYDPYCASSAIAGVSMKNSERLIIEYVEAFPPSSSERVILKPLKNVLLSQPSTRTRKLLRSSIGLHISIGRTSKMISRAI